MDNVIESLIDNFKNLYHNCNIDSKWSEFEAFGNHCDLKKVNPSEFETLPNHIKDAVNAADLIVKTQLRHIRYAT